MAYRTIKPYTGGIFHIFNRSINHEEIFSKSTDSQRMLTNIAYYRQTEQPVSLSYYLAWCAKNRSPMSLQGTQLITIIAYCLMPTHFHLLVKQEQEKGVSTFMANIQNSYTRYYNSIYDREGHLFQGQYKLVEIDNNDSLLHVSRYIHLNPSTAKLVSAANLDTYEYSSFHEITHHNSANHLANTSVIIDQSNDHDRTNYIDFVKDNIDYQRKLKMIEKLTFD